MPSSFVVKCPHCNEYIEILEINCAIFRHAAFKETGEQVGAHETREHLEEWEKEGRLVGCGKPFRLVRSSSEETGEYTAETCEYI